MEKQVILNIHNHPIVTNLFISTRNSHRFTYVGGQINMTVSSNYDLRKIEKSIQPGPPQKPDSRKNKG